MISQGFSNLWFPLSGDDPARQKTTQVSNIPQGLCSSDNVPDYQWLSPAFLGALEQIPGLGGAACSTCLCLAGGRLCRALGPTTPLDTSSHSSSPCLLTPHWWSIPSGTLHQHRRDKRIPHPQNSGVFLSPRIMTTSNVIYDFRLKITSWCCVDFPRKTRLPFKSNITVTFK